MLRLVRASLFMFCVFTDVAANGIPDDQLPIIDVHLEEPSATLGEASLLDDRKLLQALTDAITGQKKILANLTNDASSINGDFHRSHSLKSLGHVAPGSEGVSFAAVRLAEMSMQQDSNQAPGDQSPIINVHLEEPSATLGEASLMDDRKLLQALTDAMIGQQELLANLTNEASAINENLHASQSLKSPSRTVPNSEGVSLAAAQPVEKSPKQKGLQTRSQNDNQAKLAKIQRTHAIQTAFLGTGPSGMYDRQTQAPIIWLNLHKSFLPNPAKFWWRGVLHQTSTKKAGAAGEMEDKV